MIASVPETRKKRMHMFEEQLQPMLTEIMHQKQVPGMVVGLWRNKAPALFVVNGTDAYGQTLRNKWLGSFSAHVHRQIAGQTKHSLASGKHASI
jgi:dihydroxyacid dehydratase/phosphogluconate dehydratase